MLQEQRCIVSMVSFLPLKIRKRPELCQEVEEAGCCLGLEKDTLGFDCDGDKRTILLDAAKKEKLFPTLKEWTHLV